MKKDWLNDSNAALDKAAHLADLAKSVGADISEAVFSYARESGVTYRDGEVTELEQAESLELGLRVWVGDRVAYLAGNQIDKHGLKDLAEQAVSRAKLLPPSVSVTLPDKPETPTRSNEVDPSEPSLTEIISSATYLYEQCMRRSGITNSDGGQVGWSKGRNALVSSNGLSVSRANSRFQRGISVLAGNTSNQVRSFDYSTATHLEDLIDLDSIIDRATSKALAKVGAAPIESFIGDVIFDAPMAKSIVGGFLGGINGSAVAKGQSFLKDKMEERIFPPEVQILDDPTLRRGLSSRSIDREGHVPNKLDLVKKGVLKNWLLDRRSAAMLGLATNGRAVHAGGGTIMPTASNVLVSGGKGSQTDLISKVERGLLVTDMMGSGLNPLTGDYSRGAEGFLIEDGKLGVPVQSMTIAGSMMEIFSSCHLGGDLDQNGSMHCPSIFVPGLQIAGRG